MSFTIRQPFTDFFTIKQPFKDVIHTFINAYKLETLDNLSQRFVIIRQPSKDIVNHKKISQIFCLLDNLSQTLLTISPNHSQMFKKIRKPIFCFLVILDHICSIND